MARLDNQVAIVTGAATGIGRAIARRFAREGASLMLADIAAVALAKTVDEIGATGTPVASFAGDLTQRDNARALIARGLAEFRHIDVLVNNVGGGGGRKPSKIYDADLDDWEHVFNLNVLPTLYCTRFVAPRMVARKQGRIVCIGSGAREGNPWMTINGASAYSAAKGAVHSFVRSTAMELAPHGIRVNSVAPGPIDNERTGPFLRKLDAETGVGPSLITPMGRMGTSEEVAEAVLFMSSDECGYLTGQTLNVNGGR